MSSVFMRMCVYRLAFALAAILLSFLDVGPGAYAQSGGSNFSTAHEREDPKDPPNGNMSGKWKLAFTTPDGPEDATLDLQMASDGSLSGKITSKRGTASISSGYLSGDKFRFTINVRIEDNPTNVVFDGTFEGTALKGTFDVMGYSIDFSGTKPRRNPRVFGLRFGENAPVRDRCSACIAGLVPDSRVMHVSPFLT
jgi:hypothetical protein